MVGRGCGCEGVEVVVEDAGVGAVGFFLVVGVFGINP